MKLRKPDYKVLWKRLAAYAIDWYLCAVILIGFNALFAMAKGIEPTYYMTVECYAEKDRIMVLGCLMLLHVLYYVVVPIVWHGQTIGKKLLKLQIVSHNQKPVTILQLLSRELLGMVLIEGYFSPLSSYLRTYLALRFGDILVLNRIWYGVAVISLILAIRSAENRMLHDYIGNTKVTVK